MVSQVALIHPRAKICLGSRVVSVVSGERSKEGESARIEVAARKISVDFMMKILWFDLDGPVDGCCVACT